MANQNITQLSQQTGSATTSSLFYAVTGGNTDTGLPLSVLVNNLGLTGTPTAPTATTGTNTTQIASTAFVQATVGSYAALAGATFTGTVVIPTVTISGGTINGTSVGATTPSTGAFTTLSASSTVSGTGFTSLFAAPPAIGGTTAAAGSFTTLSTSGVYTPSTTNGIKGTTLGDNAVAGSIGEVISSSVAVGSAVSMSTTVPLNVTSISLTAGDWDVFGAVNFSNGATTTVSYTAGSASLTSAALNSGNFFATLAPGGAVTSVSGQAIPTIRVNVATTTTVYLVAQAGFATSTLAAFGNITARRRR